MSVEQCRIPFQIGSLYRGGGNFIGFVLMLAISYGFYKPIIGFAVLMVFVIASVLLTLLSLNRLNDQAKDNELFDNLIEADTDYFKRTRYRFTFISLFINAIVVLWSLPFVIVRDAVILDSIITFEYYLKLVPLFILITLVIFLITNKIGLHFFLGEKYRIIFTKSVILLDIFQILCPFLIIVFAYLMIFLKVNIGGIVAIPLYIFLFLSFIFPAVYFTIKYKENRKLIVVAGIRNIGLWIAFTVFSRDVSSYEVIDGINNSVENGISYNPYYTIPAIILLVAVICGYILLKKYWVER